MSKAIVVAERDNIAAVLEDGKVCEFYVHRGDMLLNDVYLATVDNILPSIDAAFVNVGYDKMGFLHANDAIGKGTLKEKLSPKQKIIVQVVKEPVGHKGPRVSTLISLPGRFLVLMPQETGVNVSKKITNSKERARLKSIINLLKPVGVGVIVRTEAEGQTEADIQEDLEILLEKWNTIITSAETRPAPSLLHRDRDLLYMVMREACSEDVDEIVIDTPYGMHRTQQILQNWNMNKNIDVSVYKGSETLLVASGIMKEIKSALQTKVNLPSGGYLFIQTTEALTVIDVNSGKFVSSTTQDETILKTNIEAVHEIARQLRLRNIGGMVIVDFIDMNNRRDKLAIMEELELAFEKDKAKPQVGQLSDLGLVELTRHRQGQSLSEIFAKKCPHCQGIGYIAEDVVLSAPAVEGEIKSKAAKLKIPVQQIKNKTPNYKQNKVFNNPDNNPLKDDNEHKNGGNNSNNNNGYSNNNANNRNRRKNFNKRNNRNNQNGNFKENIENRDLNTGINPDTDNLTEVMETDVLNVTNEVVETLQAEEHDISVEQPAVIVPEEKEESPEKEEKKPAKRGRKPGRKPKNAKVEESEALTPTVEVEPEAVDVSPSVSEGETVSAEAGDDEISEKKPAKRGRKPSRGRRSATKKESKA